MKAADFFNSLFLMILIGLVAYGLFGRPTPGVKPLPLEYNIETIPDLEWDTKGKELGDAGWDFITCRRASDGEKTFSYECIMKRPKTIP